MTPGKWTCSDNEEEWNCGEEFETRDEATAYAVVELCPDHNVEDGGHFYTGQIGAIDLTAMAERACDAEDAIESMSEWLYENVGEHAHDALHVTKAQGEDLDARLAKVVTEWMAEHAITPKCFTIEHVESATWEQCNETRMVEEPIVGLVTERCITHLEHEGVHQWP